jgi:hypothetical protein
VPGGRRVRAPIRVGDPAPAALALFLAVLSLPVMLWLRSRHVPSWLAILIPS